MRIPEYIPTGFNSMKTINAYASQFKHTNSKDWHLCQFNKAHGTSYENWDDISKNLSILTGKDIIDYHTYLNWYLMYKTDKEMVETITSTLKKKEQRIIKDHTFISFLF